MYLIDHVAELRFVSRFIYAIKRIYTHCQFTSIVSDFSHFCKTLLCVKSVLYSINKYNK